MAHAGSRVVTEIKQITTNRGVRWYEVTQSEWSDDGVVQLSDPVRLYSVTTLISRGIPKPALVNWVKKFTAEQAYDNFDVLALLHEKGQREEAIDLLKRYPDRKRDMAGEVGTAVHNAIEQLGDVSHVGDVATLMQSLDDEVRPYVMQFLSFVEDVNPEFIVQEATCWNASAGYAGTLDAIVNIGGKVGVFDIKTGRAYPEAALQLAAYRASEFVMDNDEPVPTESYGIETSWVFDVSPDGWRLIEVDSGPEVQRMFMHVREVGGRWAYGLEKEVFGTEQSGKAAE